WSPTNAHGSTICLRYHSDCISRRVRQASRNARPSSKLEVNHRIHGAHVQTQAGHSTLAISDLLDPGGVLTSRFGSGSLPVLTASKCSHSRPRCHESTKGTAGS